MFQWLKNIFKESSAWDRKDISPIYEDGRAPLPNPGEGVPVTVTVLAPTSQHNRVIDRLGQLMSIKADSVRRRDEQVSVSGRVHSDLDGQTLVGNVVMTTGFVAIVSRDD